MAMWRNPAWLLTSPLMVEVKLRQVRKTSAIFFVSFSGQIWKVFGLDSRVLQSLHQTPERIPPFANIISNNHDYPPRMQCEA